MKTILPLFIFIFTFASCNVSKLIKYKSKEKVEVENKFTKFTIKKDAIIIKTHFPNNDQHNMILDLGAGTTVLLKNCGLNYFESLPPDLNFGKIISADNTKIKADYYKIGTIKTNAFTLSHAFLSVIPDFQLVQCDKSVGVWGADIFEDKVLILRMEDSTMAVFDTLPSLSKWTIVESDYKFPHFYVVLKIGNQKMKFLLDTGCSSGIVISQDYFNKEFHGKGNLIKDSSKWFGRAFSTASGFLAADTTTKAILTESRWGDLIVDSIPLLINNNMKRNVIGMDVFKRFNLLLDYKNNKIYVQKNTKFVMPPLTSFFRKMGFSFQSSKDNTFTIAVLKVNSPAEKAGLKVGDQILSINNIKTDVDNNCEIINLLNGLDGSLTNNEVIVRRNNETLTFNF